MCILDIANVCNNYFVELCNYVKSKPKLFKQKKDQCIDILYIYIYVVNSGSVGAPVYSLQTLKCSFSVSASVSKPFLCC